MLDAFPKQSDLARYPGRANDFTNEQRRISPAFADGGRARHSQRW
jgi:hypothetical protein